MSKPPPPAPTTSAVGLCPTLIQISRTLRQWKLTQHHHTIRSGRKNSAALGIPHGSVSTILHDRLCMRKLTARWVPKSLSDEQMATRASVCSALLKHFRSKDDFPLRLVIVVENWIRYYEPENKAQSRQWVGPGSSRSKKFKTQPSAGKVMATVFWDAKGVNMLDFLPKRSTITVVYYANLLAKLRTAIREKRRGKL